MKATDFKKRLNGIPEFSVQVSMACDLSGSKAIVFFNEADCVGDRTGRRSRLTLTIDEARGLAFQLRDMADYLERVG